MQLSPQSARIRRSPRKHALAGKKTNPEGLVFYGFVAISNMNTVVKPSERL
jgi:hypothetical protein